MKNLKEFKPLLEFIKEDKGKLILSSVFIFLSGVCEVFTGYLNGAAVEAITKLNLEGALLFLGIYFLLGIIVHNFIDVKANSMLQKVESKISRKLGYHTYKKALNLPAVAYEEKTSGEITNRIINDADTLSFVFGQLLHMVSSLVGSLIIIIYIFINAWIIGVEILIFLGILLLILRKYNPLMKDAHKDRKDEQDKFTSLVTESIRGVREIKTLGVKNSLLNDMKVIIKGIFDKSIKEIDIRQKFRILTNMLRSTLEVGVFVSCALLLFYGKTTLTFFIAMTYYVYRFMYLIDMINDFSQTYQRLVVSLGRVNEILLNRTYKDEEFGKEKFNVKKGIIEFKDVTFGYPNEEVTLKDFNLVIEPNKKVAIVGESGQGKSTLFNLITRIFDPSEGSILVDDVELSKFREEDLRDSISIIRQEPFIFNRSIMDNFRLIDKSITLEEVRKYCKLSYLDDYIMSLPNAYDTILGESGVNLSGGQKQRLSIARTLAKNSKIILFDEATSALDNKSQSYIKASIDNLVKDHTVVIVAHRLSTIIDADVIHVVSKGKVVASGKHEELLKTSKIYKNLYETESLNS